MPVGTVGATGLTSDGIVEAVPAEAESVAPLAFLGRSHPLEFSLLIARQLWLRGPDGTLGLGGAGSFICGLLADFASTRLGVASVGRTGQDEDMVQGTAY